MHTVRNITDDIVFVGADDRRLAMFEGIYSVPRGVSYNSYLLKDEKTVLFDTVDNAVRRKFLQNLSFALGERSLDYIVVQHVEPDHTAVLDELMRIHPDAKIICSERALTFIGQFFGDAVASRAQTVKEGDVLSTGKHELRFFMAPMVHWPEVMVTYDSLSKTLFSADAFGAFGAMNGALFADEVDYDKDYMDEARRYYSNIVGKYGSQTAALLKKASALEIEAICPLHGFIWRKDLDKIISKYALWSKYEPEEHGVLIAYASIYGNTENAADIISCKLRGKGIKTVMYDVSVTPASEIISEAFRWSHFVFASTTYNAGIFVAMEAFLNDLTAHNIQKRTVAIIENGSWAPAAGALMRGKLEKCKDMNILDAGLSIRSSLNISQNKELDLMTDAIADSFPPGVVSRDGGVGVQQAAAEASAPQHTQVEAIAPQTLDPAAFTKLSYGLFVVTARDGAKDNGCIINTVTQITVFPNRITIVVHKDNFTHDLVSKTGKFNISVLTEHTPFTIFEQFGYKSGKDTDKFASVEYDNRMPNGIRYLPKHTNAVISANVTESVDCGTHTLFIADVTEAITLSDDNSATYCYYCNNIKPKPQAPKEVKKGFICKICAFIYEGEVLPQDYICPICKHGAVDFEKL